MAKQIEDTATREMLPGDDAGIAWWNDISESDRRYWMEMADSTCPADAWDHYRAARLNVPKPKRGRPASGQALSAAERKCRQRNGWMHKSVNNWSVTDCVTVLGLPELSENTYAAAYQRLMQIRGFA